MSATITRRSFLGTSATLAGSLVVGFHAPGGHAAAGGGAAVGLDRHRVFEQRLAEFDDEVEDVRAERSFTSERV